MSGAISPSLLETVARRAGIIKYLLEERADKRELETALGVSRTTITRAVDSLCKYGCIVQRDGEWEVTLVGRLSYREYERLRKHYEALTYAQPLLRHLPPETSFDVYVLIDAEVLLAEHPAPHAPIKRLEELLEDCSQIRGTSPVVLPAFVRLFSEQIVELGIDTELVLEVDLIDYLYTAYPVELDAILETENAVIWRSNQAAPFGLVLVDGEVLWIAFYDEDGGLKGAIVNDTAPALTWAATAFQRFREPATPVMRRGSQTKTNHN